MSAAEHTGVAAAGERVRLPRPSWAPAVFAFAAALTIAGIYAEFMAPGWVYSIVGGAILVAALASMIRGAAREYDSLP